MNREITQDQLIQIQTLYLQRTYKSGHKGIVQAPSIESIRRILECAGRVKNTTEVMEYE